MKFGTIRALVRSRSEEISVNFGPLFREHKFSTIWRPYGSGQLTLKRMTRRWLAQQFVYWKGRMERMAFGLWLTIGMWTNSWEQMRFHYPILLTFCRKLEMRKLCLHLIVNLLPGIPSDRSTRTPWFEMANRFHVWWQIIHLGTYTIWITKFRCHVCPKCSHPLAAHKRVHWIVCRRRGCLLEWLVITSWYLFKMMRHRLLPHSFGEFGEHLPTGIPPGRQDTEGCKIVTHFSYIVWPSAMKFCTTRGIGAW